MFSNIKENTALKNDLFCLLLSSDSEEKKLSSLAISRKAQ